jgi:hypothetical protein
MAGRDILFFCSSTVAAGDGWKRGMLITQNALQWWVCQGSIRIRAWSPEELLICSRQVSRIDARLKIQKTKRFLPPFDIVVVN